MYTENIKKRTELKLPSQENILDTLELIELGKKARIVLHDLSNHMTSLALSAGNPNPEKIRSHITYMANLLRSHIERTPNSFFDPKSEILKVVDIFSEKAGAKGVSIHLSKNFDQLYYPTQHRIFGSATTFVHIITNLLSNAIDSFDKVAKNAEKQNDAGMRKIAIAMQQNRERFILSVSDTGCGIRESILGRIFEPKFTTKPDGHGIGLWATKEYVEQKFNGNICVESSSKGSVFTVTIPTKKQETNSVSCFPRKHTRALTF